MEGVVTPGNSLVKAGLLESAELCVFTNQSQWWSVLHGHTCAEIRNSAQK